MKSTNTLGHREPIVAASSSPSSELQRPEFFRLPPSGMGDKYFGLSRSSYYEYEKLGYFRLMRIRQRGKLRGVTLVPYVAVADFIRKQGRAAA